MLEPWYYCSGGQTFGPLSDSGLEQLVVCAKIHPSTPVRRGEQGPWFAAYVAVQQIRGAPRLLPLPFQRAQPVPYPNQAVPVGYPAGGYLYAPGREGAGDGSAALAGYPAGVQSQREGPQPEPEEESPGERRQYARFFLSCLASMVLHLTLLITLGLMVERVTPGVGGPTKLNAAWLADGEDIIVDEAILDLNAPTLEKMDRTVTEASIGGEENMTEVLVVKLFELASPVATQTSIEMPFTREELGQVWTSPRPSSEPAPGRLRQAQTVGEATGGILEEIREELQRSKLLVIWLFDASISLANDRQRVAEQLQEFLRQIEEERTDESNQLLNAAFAFGATVKELEPPTVFGNRVVKAIYESPFDASGIENVLTAIATVAREYRGRWKDAIKIIVWTDESGDDCLVLEELIAQCRKARISVSVVGPSAILGREIGTQVWVHSATGQTFPLPVDRGPDTALPERLVLPYWHETPPIADSGGSPGDPQGSPALIDGFPSWYGGRQLEGIVSGFGPYALTRLTVATGGSFTVLDRPADRGPFRVESMKAYMPDYRSPGEIEKDLGHNPLRRAIVNVAALTYRGGGGALPVMHFLGSAPQYVPPAQFQVDLRTVVKNRCANCAAIVRMTDAALAEFGPNGMEELYKKETSPRWRAWYDLTRGRLLSVRVRCQEYMTACGLLSKSLQSGTNRVTFRSSSQLRNPTTAQPSKEAFRLLQRCVDENAGTPWEYLARREMDHPLGIEIRQIAIPAPPPVRPSTAIPREMAPPRAPPPPPPVITPPKL
ncbi:MAG: hypothetical protein HUU20_27750 [Pirellulales bacterium]|nr:hypothetical protein [Pirellulales bacterium]